MRLHCDVATSGQGEPDHAQHIDGTEDLLITLRNEMRRQLHLVIGMLEATTQGPLTPPQLEHISQCRAIADQLLRLGDDLVELASPQQPTPTPSAAPFSSASVIGEVISVMRVLAGHKGLELRFSMDASVPDELVSDKDLLQSILHRVLDNSIRFTSHGRIVVSVTSGAMWAPSPMLIIEVSDTGPGMPAEILAANWAPTQLPPIKNGIGLALIHSRLSVAGGKFTIVDSTCEGTTVRISVPIDRASCGGIPY